jgi:uncharacterized protein (TIGR02246 family)
MKARLPALVGLAFTLALPAAAQQMKCDGPQDACQALAELSNRYMTAIDKADAAAIAALYTPDGVIASEGPIVSGKDAIEKLYTNFWKDVKSISGSSASINEAQVRGNTAWGVGTWVVTENRSNNTSQAVHGNWGAVYSNDGGSWKFRMLTFNVIEAPPGQPASGTRTRAD